MFPYDARFELLYLKFVSAMKIQRSDVEKLLSKEISVYRSKLKIKQIS